MVSWSEFAAEAPDLAARGRGLFYRDGVGQGLLATVSGDRSPRIHPISLAIVGDRLYAFILASAKRQDLETDGRYALHNHQDLEAPSEFVVRGRARLVDDPAARDRVAEGWSFDVDDTYALFEFSIEAAVLGARDTADDWPPGYTSWPPRAARGAPDNHM